MKSKFFLWVGLAAAALLLAACQVNVATIVSSTGAGELRTEIGFTPQEKQSVTQLSGKDASNLCADMQSQDTSLPPGTTFAQEERGDDTYCVATQSFKDLDGLRKLYVDMTSVTINELSLVKGKFVYDVDVDMSNSDSPAGAALNFEWRLTVPGSVGQNNADRVEGQTLIWTPTPGKKVNLHAESSLGLFNLDSSTIWIVAGLLLCCLCVVVIAAAAIAFFVLRRRKSSASTAPSDMPTVS
jgi:hypothetical protein